MRCVGVYVLLESLVPFLSDVLESRVPFLSDDQSTRRKDPSFSITTAEGWRVKELPLVCCWKSWLSSSPWSWCSTIGTTEKRSSSWSWCSTIGTTEDSYTPTHTHTHSYTHFWWMLMAMSKALTERDFDHQSMDMLTCGFVTFPIAWLDSSGIIFWAPWTLILYFVLSYLICFYRLCRRPDGGRTYSGPCGNLSQNIWSFKLGFAYTYDMSIYVM